MKIGFIGLGQMGSGIAANLLKAGHEVAVYNRTANKAEALVRLGAQAQRSVEAVGAGADVVITMLADDNALEDIVFGKGGVLASLKKGATHISSSTISVALSKRLGAAHAAARQHYLSAPVFFEPAGFAAPLGQEDIHLVLAAAETLNVPLPLASLLRDRFLTLLAQGGEALDWSAIGRLAAHDSGLEQKSSAK